MSSNRIDIFRGRKSAWSPAALIGWLAIAIGAATLAGCASTPSSKNGGGDATEDSAAVPAALQRRAVERWDALIAGDMEKAYGYLTPGYRQTRSLDAYKARSRAAALSWNSVKWIGGECATPESCEVKLLLNYSVRMAQAGDTPGVRQLSERWIRSGRDWYHLPER